MRTLLLISLILSCSFQAFNQQSTFNTKESEIQGFVFVNIPRLYYNSGDFSILDIKGDTILSIVDKFISINGKEYETIDEEYLYKDLIDIELLDPEYGFFILKCFGTSNGFYNVEINNSTGLIPISISNDIIEYKDIKKYVMETYPMPTIDNPLREEANEGSPIIEDFDDWTYNSVEIKGDWLRVTDDKDCYSGPTPSPVDISGWIRWRKDGKFILKVAHSC